MLTLLQKLADEIEQGQKAFAHENSRLRQLPHEMTSGAVTQGRHALGNGVWLDFQADSGVQTDVSADTQSEETTGIRIRTEAMGQSPWFSFSYGLSVSELAGARYFGQLLRCSSRGAARFRVCLRYAFPDGFQDVFCKQLVVLTGEVQEDLLFIKVDPALLEGCIGAEILFFFDGKAFDVTLHAVEALRV